MIESSTTLFGTGKVMISVHAHLVHKHIDISPPFSFRIVKSLFLYHAAVKF